jgi:phosphoglycolate phosphatase-like HAD superfamily hydrolase
VFLLAINSEVDIAGAKGAMMKTIWKRNSSWAEATEADAIIDELSEISPILAKL